MSSITIKFFTSIFLLAAISNNAHGYKLVVSNSSLPFDISHHTAVYDGQDSIYIFAGFASSDAGATNIHKYSIQDESIQIAGNFPRTGGEGFWTGNSNDGNNESSIHYFIGHSFDLEDTAEVLNFSPGQPEADMAIVGRLPAKVTRGGVARDGSGSGYVYVVGGYYTREIYRYSLTSNTALKVGTLSSTFEKPGVAYDSATSSLYIFGGWIGTSTYSRQIFRYNAIDQSLTKLNATTPWGLYYPCTLSTPSGIYIVGGKTTDPPSSGWSPLLHFNPSTQTLTTVQLENGYDGFPKYLGYAGCAYVEALNRIYVIGGTVAAGDPDTPGQRNTIMYIDLN